MPGPFPGMDPNLESPVYWQGVHQRLITYIGDVLNEHLPSRYVAAIEERLYVVQPERNIYPDVSVVDRVSEASAGSRTEQATVIAIDSDPPWTFTLHPTEITEGYIKILSVEDQNRVITTIEILSHANKLAGSDGRDLYLTKQRELLQSGIHLIEIDLLRSGEHTVAPPRELLLQQGKWDYLVSLHRGTQRGRYEVWGVTMRQPLPRFRVPLAGDDPDLIISLQEIFDRCYDAGAYARRIDYTGDPLPPLNKEDEEWAKDVLSKME